MAFQWQSQRRKPGRRDVYASSTGLLQAAVLSFQLGFRPLLATFCSLSYSADFDT